MGSNGNCFYLPFSCLDTFEYFTQKQSSEIPHTVVTNSSRPPRPMETAHSQVNQSVCNKNPVQFMVVSDCFVVVLMIDIH